MKVSVITLGCDKNTVDSERYLAQLASHGAEPAASPSDADVVVVNTCGFIDAAKKESIDAIVEAGALKAAGRCRAVVAIGCMVERHRAELAAALPEVDVFLGTSDAGQLVDTLSERGLLDGGGERLVTHPGERLHTGDLPHVRYLKISEGCDHGCAFCAIPLMRGRHRSFGLDQVIREAQLLELAGARELNLVAQDLAHYGRDRRGERAGLAELLEALLRETGVPWLRMLYLYSAGVTPRLLEVVAREPRVVRYLDMPIQHASDAVLERMRRPERRHTIRERVARFRDAVPGVAIRTTCIVGFPGETEQDFQSLLDFLEEVQFERVGAFTYSAQEGTRAAALPDDVPESVKRERLERLTELQRAITRERYEARLARRWTAMVDRIDRRGRAVGRLDCQADDVDGVTLLRATPPSEPGGGSEVLLPGTVVEVEPRAVVDDYDFTAVVTRVLGAPTAAQPAPRTRRALPLAAAMDMARPPQRTRAGAAGTAAGSFGR